jgi:predicted RNase H-like nuclease (RuvC/YqgF family)
MNNGMTTISGNLPDFPTRLLRIENTYIKEISVELAHARGAVASALPSFRSSRMNFGRILRAYKVHYKAARGWTAALQVIAEGLGCDERTVDRLIKDYERASQLPPITVEAMEAQKIDPAAHRNAPVVEKLVQMSPPASREEAVEAVKVAYQKHQEKKRARTPAATTSASVSVEEFSRRVVKLFRERYRKMELKLRDAEVRYVLGQVVAELGIDDSELQNFTRDAVARRAAILKAA